MTPRLLTPVFSSLLALSLAACTRDDIHYWVGEGANRCAVVIDWGSEGRSLAWGYKWRGTCTNLAEVVQRIVHEDPRLGSDAKLAAFSYDVEDVHLSRSKATALYSAVNGAYGTWRFFGPFSEIPQMVSTASSIKPDAVHPLPDQWFVLRYSTSDGLEEAVTAPTYAESPYGYEVVESSTLEKSPLYNQASNVLGHPTMGIFTSSSTYGDSGSTINPAYPAWSGGRLLSLVGDDDEGTPGFVTIKFDHDVLDDPNNPFGIDFLVFGNAFGVRNSKENIQLTTDPLTVSFTGKGSYENALVEVSQDGERWYAYEKGPYADSFMPTLGYLYDPAAPDTGLFNGNLYWGRAARATRPVNPACDFSSFAGLNLAQVCQRYDGSAGGTGFDLAELPLQENGNGVKWIRYVRISCQYSEEPNEDGDFGYNVPEIDAVADVAPVSDYELWAQGQYQDWATAWRDGAAEAVAANGVTNALNFAWGLSPTEPVPASVPFEITGFSKGENRHTITVRSPCRLSDARRLVVKAATRLDGGWKNIIPTLQTSEQDGDAFLNTFAVPTDAGVFFKLAVQTE